MSATAPELTVIEGGKKPLRLVEAFRHQNSTAWEVADAITADIEERFPHVARATGESPANTGLKEALVEILAEARDDGVDLKTSTATDYYRTSIAWQPVDRDPRASFKVHRRLYAKPNRKELLGKWLSKYGKVTDQDAQRLLSEQKPQRLLSFLDGVEDGVRRLLIARGKPWGQVTQGDRDEIAARLRGIAEEIQHREGRFS